MEADFMDEAGRHIPAEFKDKGIISRWLKKFKKV